MGRRVQTAVVVLTVAAAVLLAYLPILCDADPRVLLGRADFWGYFLPSALYMDHTLHSGEWPSWNPLVLCGTPFSANPQAAVFYPPHLLRALMDFRPTLHSAAISLWFMQGFHMLVLATGMALLCRSHRLRWLPSSVAALSFALSGSIALRATQHWQFIAYAAWAPWICLLLRRLLATATPAVLLRRSMLLGLPGAMAALAGFPQLCLYLALLAAVCSAGYAAGSRSRVPLQSRAMQAAALCAAGVFAAALSMPLLLPAMEFAAHCARSKTPGEAGILPNLIPVDFLHHPGQALKILVLFQGYGAIQLAGFLPALLALCAACHRRRGEALPYLLLLAVMLDCCIGPPMPFATLVAIVAPFHVAEPARASVFACFAVAMLAGFGMDALIRRERGRRRDFLPVLAGLLAVGALLALYFWEWDSPEYPTTGLALSAQAAGAGLVILILFGRAPARGVPLVAVLLAAELLVCTRTEVGADIRSFPYPGDLSCLNAPPAFSKENRRGFGAEWLENQGMLSFEPVVTGYDPLMLTATRMFLCAPNQENRYNRRLSENETARQNSRGLGLAARMLWLLPQPPPETPPGKDIHVERTTPEGGQAAPPCSLARPSSSQAIPFDAPAPDGAQRATIKSEPFTVPRRHAALTIAGASPEGAESRVDFADCETGQTYPGQNIRWPGGGDTMKAGTLLPEFPAETKKVYLQLTTPPPGRITLSEVFLQHDEADEGELLSIVQASANELVVQTAPLPDQRHLLFTGSSYPGWSASVDGKPAPLRQACGVFQSVPLERGAHRIVFSYHPTRITAGLAISACALAVTGLVLALTRQSRRGRKR